MGEGCGGADLVRMRGGLDRTKQPRLKVELTVHSFELPTEHRAVFWHHGDDPIADDSRIRYL